MGKIIRRLFFAAAAVSWAAVWGFLLQTPPEVVADAGHKWLDLTGRRLPRSAAEWSWFVGSALLVVAFYVLLLWWELKDRRANRARLAEERERENAAQAERDTALHSIREQTEGWPTKVRQAFNDSNEDFQRLRQSLDVAEVRREMAEKDYAEVARRMTLASAKTQEIQDRLHNLFSQVLREASEATAKDQTALEAFSGIDAILVNPTISAGDARGRVLRAVAAYRVERQNTRVQVLSSGVQTINGPGTFVGELRDVPRLAAALEDAGPEQQELAGRWIQGMGAIFFNQDIGAAERLLLVRQMLQGYEADRAKLSLSPGPQAPSTEADQSPESAS